jgi:hypothetical protein
MGLLEALSTFFKSMKCRYALGALVAKRELNFPMTSSSRGVFIAIVALFATLIPGPLDARLTGHLFVATTKRPYAILSFPLNDGIPARTPDFSYPGHFNNITVGPDGSIYGVHWRNQQLVVFAPDNAVPVRRINFPSSIFGCQGPYNGPTLIGAIAVNKADDLFVAYTTYFSGLHPAAVPIRVHGATGFPCIGVVAFGPSAHGSAQPKASISLSGQYLNGVAVDADGLLYVSNSFWTKVQIFADPASHPRAVDYLTIGMSYPGTLWTDRAENLYELDGGLLTKSGVNVYAAGSGHTSPPSSTLTFQSGYNWVEDMAVWDGYLYASDINYHSSSSSSIDVYKASASGPATPIFSLPLKGIWFIAAGP